MGKLRLQAPASVGALYLRLFVNRRAYTLQSNRPHLESGRHYLPVLTFGWPEGRERSRTHR